MFIFRPNTHSLQILLFQAKAADAETRKHLKVNREINLQKFDIAKPTGYGDDNDSHYPDKEQEKIRERQQQKETRARCDVALQVIEVIKEIKANCTGDIYQDFYQNGEPGSDDIDQDKFEVHVDNKASLEKEISQALTNKIQFKYNRSKNFLEFNQKFSAALQKRMESAAISKPNASKDRIDP